MNPEQCMLTFTPWYMKGALTKKQTEQRQDVQCQNTV